MAASPAAIARANEHRAYIRETWRKQTPEQQAQALRLSAHYIRKLRSQLIKAGGCDPSMRAGKGKPWAAAKIRAIVGLIRDGYDLEDIAPRYKVSPDAISEALRVRGYAVERLRAGYVWSQHGLAQLFGVHEYTMDVWVRAGWIVPTVAPRRRKERRYFTRAAIQAMLCNRLTWPVWSPEQIADPELRAFARFERAQACGRWVKARDKAQRMGYAPGSVSSLARHGTFGADVLRVAGTWYVWEAS